MPGLCPGRRGRGRGWATAASDVLHLRLAWRSDAMVAPLRLACLIAKEAGQLGCEAAVVLVGVRDPVLAEHGRHDG